MSKKYIVRANADICLTISTDSPEIIKGLLESALMDVCDVDAKVYNISIKEQSELSEEALDRLRKAFIGRRSL